MHMGHVGGIIPRGPVSPVGGDPKALPTINCHAPHGYRSSRRQSATHHQLPRRGTSHRQLSHSPPCTDTEPTISCPDPPEKAGLLLYLLFLAGVCHAASIRPYARIGV